MIQQIFPLSAGNALRLYLAPPVGATSWRVLRRTTDAFTGPDDAGAVVVVDASTDSTVLDWNGLVNGTAYFYCVYFLVAGAYVASEVGTATPIATYEDGGPDLQELLRDRLTLGLAVEVARGVLLPPSGAIAVYTAPFGFADAMSLPCLSVHVDSTGPSERMIGENLLPDFEDMTGWHATEGWLATWRLAIVAVSLNGDERILLRKAIRRIIQANLPILSAYGVLMPDFQQTDAEAQGAEGDAPLYFSRGSFTCLAPAFVTDTVGTIADVGLTAAVPATETALDFLYG